MIVVHHLDNSRSQRVLWLLEELEVPYETRHYARDSKTMLAPAALRAVHPLGKAPVVTMDDHVLAETGHIVDTLIAHHGGGRLAPPADEENALRHGYWMHFAEGSAMPPLVMTLVLGETAKRAPFILRPMARIISGAIGTGYLKPTIRAQLDFMETELGRSAYFAGETLTGSDIMMSFPVEAAAARIGLGARPRLSAWLDGIHARPAWRRALEKGGAYSYA